GRSPAGDGSLSRAGRLAGHRLRRRGAAVFLPAAGAPRRAGRGVARHPGDPDAGTFRGRPGRNRRPAPDPGASACRFPGPGFPRVARQVARLIGALLLAGTALVAHARGGDDLKTPRTPWAALSPDEQRILGPVAPDWERMPGYQQE